MTTNLLALALCLTTLAACGDAGEDVGSSAVLEGRLLVRPAAGGWTPAGSGPIDFATGTTIEAAAEGAVVEASVGGRAQATFTLGPGARMKRRAPNAFDLAVGAVTVKTSGLEDRVLVYHADCYVEAGRASPGDVTFSATAVGKQFGVVAETGTIQLNAIGATPMDLNYAMLGPGEQGLAAKSKEPVKRHIDDSRAGPYLTPSVTLSAAPAGAGAPLRIEVTIAAGESGAFHGLPVAAEAPDSLVLVATGPGGERSIPLRPAHVRAGATLPSSVLARSDVAFDLPFDVPDHGLTAGAWQVRARYTSYREHADGPEWIGAVESAPVTVMVE